MKFSEMPYARPDLDAVKQQFADLLARFKAAATYAEAHAVFLEEEKLNKHVDTLAQLASVRNTIDTRDKFYDEEMNFWNEATPQLQECQNAWSRAMLDSPFRADFTAEYGDLMFVNAEIADKAFSPDILDEMAEGFPEALFRELNGGVCLLEDTVPDSDFPPGEMYILGEYCDDLLGQYINLYYGSFAALAERRRPSPAALSGRPRDCTAFSPLRPARREQNSSACGSEAVRCSRRWRTGRRWLRRPARQAGRCADAPLPP